MKKIVTAIAFALICSGAYAQFNQGRILAGGGIGFSATTNKFDANGTTTTTGKTTTFSFDPKVGYFLIDKLAVGLAFDVSSTTDKADGSSNKESQSVFSVGPFARYYLDPGLFFQAAIGFGGATFKDVDGSTTTTTKLGVFGWNIGAGYAYFLNDFVAVEPMVLYGAQSLKNKDNDAKSTDSGLMIQIGLQVYLGDRN